MKKSMITLASVLTLMATSAFAAADIGVAARAGMTGAGVEVTKYYNEKVSARVGVGTFKIDGDFDESDIKYSGKMKLSGVSVMGDYHPFAGRFRVSGGIVKMGNSIEASASMNGGTITVDGTTYTSADISSLNASVKWNKIRPYIGFGLDGGNADSDGGFYYTTDIGVVYAGKASVTLNPVCANPVTCSAVQASADAERQKLQEKFDKVKWMPMVHTSIGYRF